MEYKGLHHLFGVYREQKNKRMQFLFLKQGRNRPGKI